MKTMKEKNKKRRPSEGKRNTSQRKNPAENANKLKDRVSNRKKNRKNKASQKSETSLEQQRKSKDRKPGRKKSGDKVNTKSKGKGVDNKVARFKRNNTEVTFISTRGNRNVSKPKIDSKPSPKTSEKVEGDMICTTIQVEESVENADQYILSPLSTIWLGAAMSLKDLNKGVYKNTTEERYPITISSNIGYKGVNSKEVKNPSQSSVHNASVELKSQRVIQNTGTQMRYELYEVYSTEQLKLYLGADAQFGTGSISAAASFNFESTSYKYMAVFKQIFYDEYVDNISSDAFFKDRKATENDIYVSSISYGRMVLLSIESTSKRQQIDAMINGSYATASAEAKVNYEKTMSSSRMKAYVLGGSSGSAGKLISDLTELDTYIKDNSVYHPLNNPESPIAYRFTSAGTGALVNVISSTSYPKRECVPYTGKYEVKIINIVVAEKNKSKNMKLYGKITVKGYTKPKGGSGSYKTPVDGAVVWNRAKNNELKLGKEKGKEIGKAKGKGASIDKKRIVSFTKLAEIDQNNSYIEIKVDLSEKDALKGKKSQGLGIITKKIRLYELPEYVGMGANSNNNCVEVRDGKGVIKVNFSIKSLNSYD